MYRIGAIIVGRRWCSIANPAVHSSKRDSTWHGLQCVQVYVAFASHFTEPGHRSLSPLALGLTVWVLGEAGGLYTGAAVNPARVIAAAVVFLCTPQKCALVSAPQNSPLRACTCGQSSQGRLEYPPHQDLNRFLLHYEHSFW